MLLAETQKLQENLKDVEQAANIKRKDIARCYRLLIKELDLKMPVTDSVQCIARHSKQNWNTGKNKETCS